jgi:hypothetical protein
MKISKNELRKMIFETVLREQEGDVQGAGAGARKTNTPNKEEAGRLKSDIENKVKQIVSKVAANDSFRGMITIGKMRTAVTRAEPEELGQKIERALEADTNLKDYKEALKAGRAFKITVNKEKNSEPTAAVEDEKKKSEAKPESPDTESEKDNKNQYEPINRDDPFIYRVNTETGCWETKKKESGNRWLSLRNNQRATDVLDKKYSGARSDDLKNKCKTSASKSTGGKPKPNPPSPSEPPIPSVIKHDGTTYYYNTWEGNLDRFVNAAPGFKKYINDNINLKNERCLFNRQNNNILVYDQEGNFYNYSITSNKIEYPAPDATTTPENINYYKKMFNEILREGKVITNESYGKSHATLMRERYWGRY